MRGSSFTPSLMLATIVTGLLIGGGCGTNGPVRYSIEGKVTFGGEPVPNGLIRFEPDAQKGNRGPIGYATIVDGHYTTAEQGSNGALQGPLIAVMTGGPAKDPHVEFPKMWFEDYQTTVEFDPKAGKATFDFDVPDPRKQKPGPAASSGRGR